MPTTDTHGSDLQRIVAVITGAGRGVGLAITERLARAGASVALLARSADEVERAAASIEEAGGSAIAVAVDVTDRAAVDAGFARIQDELGPVSLLVNNAGTLGAVGPLWEVDPDVWWRDIESHVRGTLLCSRVALRSMVHRGEGRLVNVVGMLGQRGEPYVTAYACAKAAMFRLTDCLTNELRGKGVHVFAISPGPVRTAMTTPLADTEEGRRWVPEFAEMADEEWVSADRGAELVFRIARGDADGLSGKYVHVYDDLDELIATSDEIEASDRLVMRLIR